MKRDLEHFAGCLLGGAAGDALGASVEFLSWPQIRQEYSPNGITDPVLVDGKARITDDTQMTLFTAEGLLRAMCRLHHRGMCHPPAVIRNAYVRWLHTQGETSSHRLPASPQDQGWLVGLPELHAVRAPGRTCLQALMSGECGSLDEPINNSKGCGGVMRVAPIGLFVDSDKVFDMACEAAAITHGHPTGYLAAGTFAQVIAGIIEGRTIPDAIEAALEVLKTRPHHEECLAAVSRARDLAGRDQPSTAALETLGQGWIAEEALAISICCSLVAQHDFVRGVRLAVNHSGDSDSTGSIAGNILGASLGRQTIPAQWLAHLELANEIQELAGDLLVGFRDDPSWPLRYPGC